MPATAFLSEKIVDLATDMGEVKTLVIQSKENLREQSAKLDTVIEATRQTADQVRSANRNIEALQLGHAELSLRIARIEHAPMRAVRWAIGGVVTVALAAWAAGTEGLAKAIALHWLPGPH